MSATRTTTIQPTDYLAAVDDLGSILERYEGSEDSLSKSIHLWGRGVLRTVVQHQLDSEEAIANIAQERITALAREILINPIDDSPLNEPVLERDWTWERWMHGDFRELFPVSPLDNGPWEVNPPLHLFAQEMISWMRHVTTPGTLTVPNGSMGHLDEKQVPRSTKKQLLGWLLSSIQPLNPIRKPCLPSLRQTVEPLRACRVLLLKMRREFLICGGDCAMNVLRIYRIR